VNEKKQKNFVFFDLPLTGGTGREAEQKFSAAFFPKKKYFLTGRARVPPGAIVVITPPAR